MEFRESILLINGKNQRTIKENMVFNASIGFKNLKTASGRTFAVKLADTIRVNEQGNLNLSRDIDKSYDDIGYTLEGEEEEPVVVPEKKKIISDVVQSEAEAINTRSRRRRGNQSSMAQSAFMK